jgi:hypothetical protein
VPRLISHFDARIQLGAYCVWFVDGQHEGRSVLPHHRCIIRRNRLRSDGGGIQAPARRSPAAAPASLLVRRGYRPHNTNVCGPVRPQHGSTSTAGVDTDISDKSGPR